MQISNSHLIRQTKKELQERLEKMGFSRGIRVGIYEQKLDAERVMYLMCRPRARWGQVLLEPLLAIENMRVRHLIGEDEPKQLVPRVAHIFLCYTIDRDITFWNFSNIDEMKKAIDAIEDAIRIGGVPFAQRWTPFRKAVELLRRGFSRDLPRGVFTHPTRSCRVILEALPEDDRRLN